MQQDRRFHEVASIFPMMAHDELDDLTEDIREHGQREPIWLHDGQVIDGRNRFIACRRLGVEPASREWAGEGDLVSFVVSLNLKRRHLNESQRAAVAAKLATLPKGANQHAQICAPSQGAAAEMLGVSRRSTQHARTALDQGIPELVESMERGEIAVSRAAGIAKLPEEEQRKAVGAPKALQMSVSNEWYTPAEYADAARELMGSIDLDPATCEAANFRIKAAKIFTAQDDGLSREWEGNVWLNPPYGRDGAKAWSEKLIHEHYTAGRVEQAVLLVNASTDTQWFQELWNYPICFVSKRIKFISSDGAKDSPTHANAIAYMGENVGSFVKLFGEFGRVCVPHHAIAEVW